MRIALLATALGVLTGCSLQGLDQFPFPGCAELNRRDAIDEATACELWQMSPDGACRFGARDADDDGEAPLMCGGMDCDDDDGMVGPDGAEVCNGRDDDCNGLIDDVNGPAPAAVTVVEEASPIRWVSSVPSAAGLDALYGSNAIRRVAVAGAASAAATTVSVRSSAPSATLSATLEDGCFDTEGVPLGLPACPPATCGAGTSCVTGAAGSFCEEPVLPRMPAPLPTDCATHAECGDDVACNGIERCNPRSPLADARGCAPAEARGCDGLCDEARDVCITGAPSTCDVETALWAGSTADAAFAVVGTTCGMGTALRIGAIEGGTLALRGDGRVVAGFPAFGGAVRTCDGDVAAADIASFVPNASAGRATLPQGLIAWVDRDPTCDLTSCSGDALVGGLWLENGTLDGTSIRWTSAADSGTATVAVSSAREVVVEALRGLTEGYAVIATTTSGIVGRFVSPLALPSPECGTAPCLASVAPFSTSIDTSATAATRTTPAPTVGPSAMIASTSNATELAAAALPNGGVVVAWAEPDAVVVQRLTLTAGMLAAAAEPVRLAATGARDLAVDHVPLGIATVGAMLGDMRVTAEVAGGVVVTFVQGSDTIVARIADANGALVAMPARVEGTYLDRRTFVANGAAQLFARSGASLVVLPALCGE